MRLFRFTALCLLLALLAVGPLGWAMQTPPKPITQRGLMDALKIGGLAPNELVRKINDRGVSFVLTPEAEAELRKAGAAQSVIDAVRNNYRGTGAPPPAKPPATVDKSEPPLSTTPAPPTPPPQHPAAGDRKPAAVLSKPGVYVRKADQWVEVSSESVTLKKGKLKRGEMTGVLPGVQSPNAFHHPLSFIIVTPGSSNISDFTLVLLHSKKEEREFRIDASRLRGKDLLPFTPSKISDKNYQVEFTQGAGEYGFVAPGANEAESASNEYRKIYTFRVVQ